jgi:hypothetical protein
MVEIVGEHVSLDVTQTFLSDERNSAEVITRDQSRSSYWSILVVSLAIR